MAVTPIIITNDRKGYGMTLKPIRVYIGDSNNYRIHHIVQVRITLHILYNSFSKWAFCTADIRQLQSAAWAS